MLKYTLNYLQNLSPSSDGIDTRNATRGAAVAIEVNTGKILALVSEPGFNPNEFAKGELNPDVAKEYFQPDYEAFAQKIISRDGLSKTVDNFI